MSRCERCNACQSGFDTRPCFHCDFPKPDKRTEEQKIIDDTDYQEWCVEQGIEGY